MDEDIDEADDEEFVSESKPLGMPNPDWAAANLIESVWPPDYFSRKSGQLDAILVRAIFRPIVRTALTTEKSSLSLDN